MPRKLRGRIIRIVDPKTVIINLGSKQGVTHQSVFKILGDDEEIVDPFTNRTLGRISVVKGRVKAATVDDAYTIARAHSNWPTGETYPPRYDPFDEIMDEKLTVDHEDLQPWKALSEEPVKLGDEVETSIWEDEDELPI